MTSADRKYRFLLIQAFDLPAGSRFLHRPTEGAKESRLMNYDTLEHLLADVEWELHRGPLATYGDWPVESREEFALVAAGRLPIVREACESGRYNALVLLGGGEPGFQESREIARAYGIPVVSCAHSQMHYAALLGNKFSVIDLTEIHNMYYYNLVVQHRFDGRCASIRNLESPFPRPPHAEGLVPRQEKEKIVRGERSAILESAVTEAVAAIEEDGAEVLTFGCSGLFFLRPFLERRLRETGWDVPVLEGYSCAITLAKSMVDLGLCASGLTFPPDRPKKWRRKKIF
jgi:allantoin racemase